MMHGHKNLKLSMIWLIPCCCCCYCCWSWLY